MVYKTMKHFFKKIVEQLPITIGYYKRMLWINFKIPFWIGTSFNFMGQTEWHTGKLTLMTMPIYFVKWCGWCCGNHKFYHTGLYIGHHKSCTANDI